MSGSRVRSLSAACLGAIALLCTASVCDRCDPDRVSAEGFTTSGLDEVEVALPDMPFDGPSRERCKGGGLTEAGKRALGRWPYLQQVSSDGAQLLWTTREEAVADEMHWVVRTVHGTEVARAPARRDEVELAPSGPQWSATISGLEPGTYYCHQLEGDGKPWTEPVGLATAHEPGKGVVHVVALADVGMNTAEQRKIRDAFSKLPANLVLFGGDIAYKSGTRAEFEDHFFAVYRDYLLHVPAFPASGNHEYPTEDALPFREVFSLPDHGIEPGRERWYSFDYGPVHVVALDSEKLIPEQRDWLEADLASAFERQPFTIVVVHKPPYASGYHGSDLAVRELFGDVLSRYDVQLVLSGHEHHYERSRPIDGVTYVVSGGGGAGTRPTGKQEHAEVAVRVAHFTYLTVTPEALQLVAIDAEGKPFDRVELKARTVK